MNTELFAIFDTAAGIFIDPFCAPTLEFALRGFREACETDGHQFRKFPEDYALYHIGSFDVTLGELLPIVTTKVAIASNFVKFAGPELESAT